MQIKKVLRDNGLSICLFSLFAFSLAGQISAGFLEDGEERKIHNEPAVSLMEYAASGHFLEALFENWESEFLQMALYVILTAFLIQRGSAESKDPDKEETVDEDPLRHRRMQDAPWPVKKGGMACWVYSHSLSITLMALFALSFTGHAIFGHAFYNRELLQDGQPPESLWGYVTSSHFWFESFQNWQSEFLSIGLVVVLSVYLRQIGSPESKPVFYPHHKTGKE